MPDQPFSLNTWIFVGATALVALMVNLAIRWLIFIRLRHIKPEIHLWRHALLAAVNSPVRFAIWLLALSIMKGRFLPAGTNQYVDRIYSPAVGIVVTLLVTWLLLRLVRMIKSNYAGYARASGEPIDYTAVDAIGKLSLAGVFIFAIISILDQLGISPASLLAFGGAAGIAAGFAAQNLVANLFGGLTIYASHIFKIGDDIILPGTNLAGTVQQIGWRATRVLGWDGKPFYVPNSLFNSSNMVNHSRLQFRSLSENILLRYQHYDKVREIVDDANKMLEERKDIGYYVFRFDSFGEQALRLNIYAYVQTIPAGNFLPYAEFARIKEEVLLAIANIARDHGCNLVLPVSHLYVQDEQGHGLPSGPMLGQAAASL